MAILAFQKPDKVLMLEADNFFGKFEFRPLGCGMQDFGPILEACERCGTETVIVEQDSPSMGLTELESVRKSREYLRDTFGI